MTSIASEAAATIVVSCKQTRFHIENPNYRDVSLFHPLNPGHPHADPARMISRYSWMWRD